MSLTTAETKPMTTSWAPLKNMDQNKRYETLTDLNKAQVEESELIDDTPPLKG